MIIRNRFTIWLARRLVRRCQRVILRRQPDFVIGPDPSTAYMRRWWLVPRNPMFNVYLHQFLHDDEDRACHDHPWWSASLSLGGTMREIYLKRLRTHTEERTRVIAPGALVLRGARFTHRMQVPVAGPLTLFVTGPRLREWGFACDPPVGWRHWRVFTGRDNAGAIGRGCD